MKNLLIRKPANVYSKSGQRHLREYATTVRKPITKLLCANRGEIAIRIFRAATELKVRTVAIYSPADQYAAHRYKSDEAYRIGKTNSPVGAYLGIDEIIELAKEVGVNGIHPGYGFLSENAEFAKKCEDSGISFVGPSSEILSKMGDKTVAKDIAKACNVPIVPGTDGPISTYEEAEKFVSEHGLPIIIKAAFGGGGRGMRVVTESKDLKESFERCKSEGLTFFGNGTVFIERYIKNPRHIEVQILGDTYGNIIHLYERDCSIQRRHQKVVEIAPATAVGLSTEIRDRICADALKIAKHVNYYNAGTAEFLLDAEGRHYFIEVNPRLQVEHTVTEEVTGVDIVQSQILIAGGKSLPDLGLKEPVMPRGCAVQCRVTTEDPENNFQPDTGRITTFRTGEGPGIRLDGSGHAGSVISPHYDSLLVKVTGRAQTFPGVVEKLHRALREFRVRGVKTNVPFILNVLENPDFIAGKLDTGFIASHPELFKFDSMLNRGEKILNFLGHVTVNGTAAVHPGAEGAPPENVFPRTLIPRPYRITEQGAPKIQPPSGWKQILTKEGPKGFAKKIREHKHLLITDTTMRDAHQSLLATRLRSIDIFEVSPATAHLMPNLLSLENWGGATFDVAMRFLRECPWERLIRMRELIPNIPFQMLLRGANAVGYTSYPDNAVYKFCDVAVKNGMDIFRVFDSLNYMENLKLGINAVGAAGGVVEASICYTGDLTDPERSKYNLEYYLKLAHEIVKQDIHILNIKDMAGLLKPNAATILISALRKEFPDLPIHIHTHDTAGTGVATLLACYQAGADVVDTAIDSMSGTTSQPSLGALLGSLHGSEGCPDIDPDNLMILNDYWETTRALYNPFESGQKTGSYDVYHHEMPGGQYTNLLFQSKQLGLTGRWPQIKKAYAIANQACGDIVKVTPSSKVVGDLAQFMVQNEIHTLDQLISQADKLSFPSSVVEYFEGKLGHPHGGFPEPLRTKILKGKPSIVGRPGASMAPMDFEKIRTDLSKEFGISIPETILMSYAMYPQVTREFLKFQEKYGDVSVIPTRKFFAPMDGKEELRVYLAQGKKLFIRNPAVGKSLDAQGRREVFYELNGFPRSLLITDEEATKKIVQNERATSAEGSIGAPMPGAVISISIKEGDAVEKGAVLIILSAMKMETVVSSPIKGVVKRVVVTKGLHLKAGDLVAEIEPRK
eukprot:TRINITY_DN5194_c0_g1_i1.p1 TRINITY_DN5194_c0_g1~~TRINITY_DN5194_c0_g1_i1.p1  ORF type:complete len:1188 (-),score=247.95 TRINITY_DN5194_c0_g1_i1:6-3569(-)